jgi:hypothetical protein
MEKVLVNELEISFYFFVQLIIFESKKENHEMLTIFTIQ